MKKHLTQLLLSLLFLVVTAMTCDEQDLACLLYTSDAADEL